MVEADREKNRETEKQRDSDREREKDTQMERDSDRGERETQNMTLTSSSKSLPSQRPGCFPISNTPTPSLGLPKR